MMFVLGIEIGFGEERIFDKVVRGGEEKFDGVEGLFLKGLKFHYI